jgi:divalent metal cation (Fe/Co/Zn/Cd) transporter
VVRGIRKIIDDAPDILHINELRTMHLAPQEILLALSVDFADGISSQAVEKAVSQLEREIKESYPQVSRVFIEVQAKHDGMARRSR